MACYDAMRIEVEGRIAVGGDSSGGNLALAVARQCADEQRRGPDKALALSPATDMHFEHYPEFERACYLDRAQWEDPRTSPMLGRLAGLPPVFVLVGGQDPLHEENLVFERKCREAGMVTTLHFRPDLPHAFHTHHDVLGVEADAANDAIAAFLEAG
jgi:acetyl esterase/lipase